MVSAVIGVVCLAAGLQGWLLREARWWERAMLLVAAILLIKPGYISDAIGILPLVATVASQKLQAKNAATA